jgi:rhamnosyl/mannosyltransferase
MIRVLHVGKFYPPVPGGMERIVESLCQAVRGDIESSVLAFHTDSETLIDHVDGIPVRRVGTMATVGSVAIAPGFAPALRGADQDLIVLHEPNPWALVSFAIARPSPPLAIWYHSDVVRPALQYKLFYHPLVRAVYGRARRIIASSPPLAENAEALAPYRDKIAVVPFGIDSSAWTPTAATCRRAQEIRARHARPIVLFAGRHVAYKGVDVLLRALQQVEADAVIAGDGPRRRDWRALSQQLGLGARVHFPGEVSPDELAALYHACDVFALPSVTRAEAFGYVQLEAMACGKPVVSTTVASGVPWVNRDGETGLTVPPGDADALARALRTLLADDVLRVKMGVAGRSRAASEFSMPRMASRLRELYVEIAGGA